MDTKKPSRHTKIAPEKLHKLEMGFSYALTDIEACLYAGIAPRTLYYFQDENPKYVQRKERLKKTPNIQAKKTIVENLVDVSTAQWWAEHKMNDEFATKTKSEHSGKIQTEDVTPPSESDEAVKRATAEYHIALKKAIAKIHGK